MDTELPFSSHSRWISEFSIPTFNTVFEKPLEEEQPIVFFPEDVILLIAVMIS